MESSAILKIFFGVLTQFWFIWAFVLLTWLWRLPLVKGMIGEWLVNRTLARKLSQDSYQLFKNVTLPTEDGTTQIDHILLSPYGIFVIETKNMKGWIFGSECQSRWTQQIYHYKTSFQNPLRQNYKHIETLRTLLELPKEAVHSVIIFTGQAEFKTKMPGNVGYVCSGIEFIRSKQCEVFSAAQVTELARVLGENKLESGLKTHLKHVRHVKELVNDKDLSKFSVKQLSSEAQCPRCNGELVQRKNRKTGELFMGCSSFPRCRFIA